MFGKSMVYKQNRPMPSVFFTQPRFEESEIISIDLDEYRTAVIRKYPSEQTGMVYLRVIDGRFCDLKPLGVFKIPRADWEMVAFRFEVLKASAENADGSSMQRAHKRITRREAAAQSVLPAASGVLISRPDNSSEDVDVTAKQEVFEPKKSLNSKFLAKGKMLHFKQVEKNPQANSGQTKPFKTWELGIEQDGRTVTFHGNDLERAVSASKVNPGDLVELTFLGWETVRKPNGKEYDRKAYKLSKEG